jgi:hypothetical protein
MAFGGPSDYPHPCSNLRRRLVPGKPQAHHWVPLKAVPGSPTQACSAHGHPFLG